MTYREIYDICVPSNKRKADKLNPWLFYVVRPISILMTKPLVTTSIRPSSITAVSIGTTLVGFMLISFGNSLLIRIIGWLGFFMWAILDCVDGNVARCKKQTSKQGELWDATGGYIALSLLFFSAGIAAYYDTNLYAILSPEWYIVTGGMTSMLSLLPRLVAQKKKAINNSDAVKEVMDKTSFNFPKIVVMNLESAIGIMQVVFLISILTHTLNLFIIFYFILNVAITIYSLYALLK